MGPKGAALLNYYYYGFIINNILLNKFGFYKFYYIIKNREAFTISSLEIHFPSFINIIIQNLKEFEI